MLLERTRDKMMPLKNGKKALICCFWSDQQEHLVTKIRVFVESPSGLDKLICSLDGPFKSQHEANDIGAELANIWYERLSDKRAP